MRIIKERTLSTMTVFCTKCEAELEIDARDLKKEPDDDYGYGSYYYTCPCCHSTQYRRPNEITPQICADYTKLNL